MPEDQQQPNYQSTAILKELSDIKANLAVNSSETANIKLNVAEIKSDIKEIKNDYVSRREFIDNISAAKKELEDKNLELNKSINNLWKVMYFLGALFATAVINSIIKLVIK